MLLDPAPNWKTVDGDVPKLNPPVAGLSDPSKEDCTGVFPKTGIVEDPNGRGGFWDAASELSVLLLNVKLGDDPNVIPEGWETALWIWLEFSFLAPNTKLLVVDPNAGTVFWDTELEVGLGASLFENTKLAEEPMVEVVLPGTWLPNWKLGFPGWEGWNAENAEVFDDTVVTPKIN